jgi:hypothetical protein
LIAVGRCFEDEQPIEKMAENSGKLIEELIVQGLGNT